LTDFQKNNQISNFMQIHLLGGQEFLCIQRDRQTRQS